MSKIKAGTTTTTAYQVEADTTGTLVLQTGATPTTALTISSAQVATFAQAPVLPAASIPQAALAANVAGNGPAFSIYATGTTSVPTSTYTKVIFNGSIFDTTGGMVSSSRFTPTLAGYYYITGSAYFSSSSESFVQIQKNGAELHRGTDHGSQVYSRTVSGLVYLNGSTDYVEIYTYQSSGSTVTVSATMSQTIFQGFLARSA